MENITQLKIESYQQQKKRHSEEISSFDGLFWAFSKEQLNAGLNKINATVNDVVSIGAGGIILKNKVQAFKDLLERHGKERKELKKNEKELFNALVYELNNNEYCITRNTKDALDALGLTKDDIDSNLLKKACKESLEQTLK